MTYANNQYLEFPRSKIDWHFKIDRYCNSIPDVCVLHTWSLVVHFHHTVISSGSNVHSRPMCLNGYIVIAGWNARQYKCVSLPHSFLPRGGVERKTLSKLPLLLLQMTLPTCSPKRCLCQPFSDSRNKWDSANTPCPPSEHATFSEWGRRQLLKLRS
jgi:hypothetical protein